MISIFKFGGSCLKDSGAFQKIERIISLHASEKKIFVVSALQSITDLLMKTANYASNHKKFSEPIQIIKDKHYSIINEIFKEYVSIKKELTDFINEKLDELETQARELRNTRNYLFEQTKQLRDERDDLNREVKAAREQAKRHRTERDRINAKIQVIKKSLGLLLSRHLHHTKFSHLNIHIVKKVKLYLKKHDLLSVEKMNY